MPTNRHRGLGQRFLLLPSPTVGQGKQRLLVVGSFRGLGEEQSSLGELKEDPGADCALS